VTKELSQSLAEFGVLVDSKTGVIASVELVKLSETDPVVFLAHAEPCDTTPIVGLAAANRGAACSASSERAVVRACGESVERYCSAFFDVGSLPVGSAEELRAEGRACVRPEDLYPFADWQYVQPGFPYERSDERALRWVEGASAITGEPVLIPASCVYVPYLFDAAVEPFTHMPISTGLAAGRTVDDCIAKGILEILERDALMIVWHGELPMPRLDPESCRGYSPLVDQLLAAGSHGRAEWHLNVLTLDVDVPIISAALIDAGSPPLTSLGIAASTDPARALLLALEEAVLTRVLVNRMEEAQEDSTSEPGPIRTLHDHLVAHATSSELREHLRFLTNAGDLMPLERLIERFHASTSSLEERILRAGLDALWVDVTTEDVAELAFRVVRTVMPGLHPLDNDHRYPHLGVKRRITVPVALGLGNPGPMTYNRNPHPFP
jgi:ribosomal protein S12 methylthiotransferase accessory factor